MKAIIPVSSKLSNCLNWGIILVKKMGGTAGKSRPSLCNSKKGLFYMYKISMKKIRRNIK